MVRKELEGKIQGEHCRVVHSIRSLLREHKTPKIQHQKVHVFPRQADGHLKCDTFNAVFAEYCALLKNIFMACII